MVSKTERIEKSTMRGHSWPPLHDAFVRYLGMRAALWRANSFGDDPLDNLGEFFATDIAPAGESARLDPPCFKRG